MIKTMNTEEVISLKEFILEKFTTLEKSTEAARCSMEKRLDGMNEFRDTLRDQASRFITRSEHEAMMQTYNKDIIDLQISRAALAGKADQKTVNMVLIFSLLATMISSIDLILKFAK